MPSLRSHASLGWAVLMGLAGALATLVFRAGVALLENAVTRLYGLGHDLSLVEIATALPWPVRLLLPPLGGLLAGGILWFARRRPTPRVSDYMEVVSQGDGRVPVRDSILRALSSLFSISSGGSIGREGPMIQLAALAASVLGRLARLDAERLRLLVACGAAAGITSAYNTPIAGAFFVAEVVLGRLAMASMGPILVASVVANILMRALPGYRPAYEMPPFAEIYGAEVAAFALLGVLAGLLAPRFVRLLESSRRQMARLPLPAPLRLALGGLGVGLISVWVPQVWGNGYEVVNGLLHGHWIWQAVLLVLVCKVLATMLTVGSGAVGGVFTPTLFVGATLGWLIGTPLHALYPAMSSAPSAYAMVGMGAFLAAATGAPLMAILMIFEMTLSYAAMLPLVLATVIAYFVAGGAAETAMYAVTVVRGRRERERTALRAARVGDLVQATDTVIREDADLDAAARLFFSHPIKFVYVVDAAQCYLGVVALRDITASLLSPVRDAPRRCVHDLLSRNALRPLTPEMGLSEALERFLAHPGERLPVVAADSSSRFLGIVNKSTLLDAYVRLSSAD